MTITIYSFNGMTILLTSLLRSFHDTTHGFQTEHGNPFYCVILQWPIQLKMMGGGGVMNLTDFMGEE